MGVLGLSQNPDFICRVVQMWYRNYLGGTVGRKRERYEAGIYKETSPRGTRYIARWRGASGEEYSRAFPKLQDARDYRNEALAHRKRDAEKVKGKGVTVSDVADIYLAQHAAWRDSTRSTQESRLTSIREAFGEREIQSVNTSDVRKFLSGLHAKGRTPKTQEATRSTLLAVFQVALDDGLVTKNPVAAVRSITDKRTLEDRDARLSEEQVQTISEHLPSDEWRRFLYFILGTGMRGGEAAGLTWAHVDFLHNRIRVEQQLVSGNYGDPIFGPPKTKNSTRWVPIRPGIREVLEEQRNVHPASVANLVWVSESGSPMGRGVRSEAWRTAAEGLDLPPAVRGWHAVRHTAGSRLLDSGAPITAIAAMFGHTVQELTSTYAHADVDYATTLSMIPISGMQASAG
jgi:integrase